MLVIAMFIILLGFMSFSGQQVELPLTNASESNQLQPPTEVASESLAIPDKQALQFQYLQEQLNNERTETTLNYQKQIEMQRLEYGNLTEQQRLLHEKSLQESAQQNTLQLKQQELQKDYMQGQQALSKLESEKQHEAEVTHTLLSFEKEKQQMTQAHEAALAIQKADAEQRSMLNIALIFSTIIISSSVAYFFVSSLKVKREKELAKIEYDKLFALKQQESMQATRIKVLDSIADLPGPDKKEIIEGLVGLNRSYDVLENNTQQNPPIEIELTDLTPPQMQPVSKI
ncbi:hypothetical protein DKT75_12170 [Leucothrix arctica]|uniref:Uncharacterized protein n=2 Tax=Leucothrix arctica TaxID=1481894 RepID=A0A317CH06_9GAMM|nr:hypothetical protein DKT75_12170 [Leucothrix arctica]